jgi:hypothetical protein
VAPQTSEPPATHVQDLQPPFGGHAEPPKPAASEPQPPPTSAVQPPPRAAAAQQPRDRDNELTDQGQPRESVMEATAEEYQVPEDFANKPGARLLMKICNLFGIDPNPRLPVFVSGKHDPARGRFRELLSWRHYPGDPMAGVPESVTLVTSGGLKLNVNSEGEYDEATEVQLRNAFRAFRTNPKTNEVEPLPLPNDMTLPATAVLGIPASQDHVYQQGYLRSGGRAEADRREQQAIERRRQAFQQSDPKPALTDRRAFR